ncbi:FAD-linked oxidase C-terminal domain-containing protein [Anaerotruncus colihominis]|uniref:FAD-binding oxidoreductase/transferase type 4 C-terminal domain-containing protein n=1 Tax=Anaerotruncus colihominis TaxID=169435 RepID=A0A845RJX6_9FIRM|nr:FAD-linked oxidase C-terminal domain-containing protein [Anaerotruncus colihominis]NBI80316.1 hypothetical protein [Anaerotruncus colihominis]
MHYARYVNTKAYFMTRAKLPQIFCATCKTAAKAEIKIDLGILGHHALKHAFDPKGILNPHKVCQS